jgi:type VI protein secretion system component VasK
VAQYANDYRAQVDRFYQSFGLRAPSAEALRVALAQMVADTSIFADFLGAMVSNTHLDAEGPMLAPMKEALREYTQLHEVVNPAKGAPPLNNYKAILGALLADLGTTKEAEKGVAAAPPDPGKPADNETLQEALTPSGKLALADMRREKGSYSLLVDTWLGDVRLPASQHAPFIAPLRELFGSGRADVERVVSRVWQVEVVPDLQRILQRFPFDQTSRDDATPEELTEVFHPTEGRFFNLFRRYIEPLTALDGGPFRELPGVRGLVQLPRDMYPCINKVAALSARLWDETGKPLLIPVRVATLSFERQASTDAALTLVYLNVGDTAVFNFNQKPAWSDIRLDWTKRHNAQIGVQLTNVESRENEFPEPLAVQNSFWSFYRLVRLATVSPVREPPDGLLHTWSIPRRRGGSEKLRGSFVVRGDIWSPFKLGKKREGVR